MKISAEGRKLIEREEELRLTAYPDEGGVWTIGYGHTFGVKEGDCCTAEQADEWLAGDIRQTEDTVNALVDVPLTQNQFDSLVSLVFNIGAGHFDGSTVLRRLNQGDYLGAADAFLLWNRVRGSINRGLVNRRDAERKLFLT